MGKILRLMSFMKIAFFAFRYVEKILGSYGLSCGLWGVFICERRFIRMDIL